MQRGVVVGERFEIDGVAGEGGMATVYRARDRTTGAPVALKVVRLRDTDTFDDEAAVLRKLSHPGIVRYVAHGRSPEGPYLAMEWLEGEDLEQRLARDGPLGIEASMGVVLRVAEALVGAHALGVVHSDLKPGNIWLEGRDLARVKIVDFGIARGHAPLVAGIVAGTPAYMAPEQVRGSSLDARADVYALGCVLFQCLTGKPPFVADEVIALLAKTLLDDAPRLLSVMPDAPPALDALLARALAKDPRRRPPNAAALAAELAAAPAGGGRMSIPPPRVLTSSEQRVVSVILFGAHYDHDATVSSADWDAVIESARKVVSDFGAGVEVMVGGSVAVVLGALPSEQAGDVTRRAGSCAIALKRATSAASLALATGRAERGPVPIGEALDRAAALLGQRRPGIRVDEVTASLLGDDFDVVRDVLLGRRETDETRTLLGKRTPLFGRSDELARIEAGFARCATTPSAAAMVVVAAAGMGKSRLRREVVRVLRARSERPEIWTARGDPVGAGSAFGLAAQIVRRAAVVRAGEPEEETRDKLQRRVAQHVAADSVTRVTHFLAEVVGAPFAAGDDVALATAHREPTVMFDQIRGAWDDFIEAECTSRPLVIVLDDLQWGDQPTVSLCDSALRVCEKRPLFLIAFARPEGVTRFGSLWAERRVDRLDLRALSHEAGASLVRYALGDRATAPLTERLLERAGGNAFYLEELVRAVAEGRDSTPHTALLVVQSRLEGLDPETRRVARAASVFGRTFWASGVAALVGDEGVTEGHLRELEEREIVHRRAASKFADTPELAFDHVLVQEAAYAMLVGDDRTLGHDLAAQWLESHGETDAVVLAEHWELAKRPARALEAWTRAAAQALDGNDYTACVDRAERAVRCGARGDVLAHVRELQAEAHRWMGDNVAMAARAREAAQLRESGSDAWAKTASTLALAYQRLGRTAEVVSLGEGLAGSMRDAGSARISAAATVASVLTISGHRAAASSLLDAALAAVVPETDPETRARLEGACANRALFEGRAAEYVERSIVAATEFTRAGDRRLACVARLNAGHGMLELGLYGDAAAALHTAADVAERFGLRTIAATANQNLALARWRTGDVTAALAILRATAAAFDEQGNRRLQGFSHVLVGRILCDGDPVGARESAQRALAMAESAGPLRVAAFAVIARASTRLGEHEAALAAAREAMTGLTAHGVEEGEGFVRLACAEAFEAAGAHADAHAARNAARARVLERAASIGRDDWRAAFLAIEEHAAIMGTPRRG